jgi:hypothetical protein
MWSLPQALAAKDRKMIGDSLRRVTRVAAAYGPPILAVIIDFQMRRPCSFFSVLLI